MSVHVIPIDDDRPHARSLLCPCRPRLDESGTVVHEAFDRRQDRERITGRGVPGKPWGVYPESERTLPA